MTKYIDPMLRRLIDVAFDALPAQCEICHAWPAQVLCETCIRSHLRAQNRCRTCALPLPPAQQQCGACLRQPPPLDSCLAAVSYEFPWSNCITRFKYGSDPGWARTLARLLLDLPAAREAILDCDALIPMPLSSARLTERGFNQALELARYLAPAKTTSQLLLRIRDTLPQSSLSREQRQKNVKGAFMVAPESFGWVQQKKLLLVDDVMTSGASLFAAAAALRQAGAASVAGMVVARTDSPNQGPAP